ncbi:MAG TPA: hypothetical protein VME46_09715 [Acidimicrobiales bacterium]|nr:hypothetical protein [Acidimicrobiales bacterium]
MATLCSKRHHAAHRRPLRGTAAAIALVVGTTGAITAAGPAWASARAGALGSVPHVASAGTHEHSAVAGKPGPLSGTWAGSYSGSFSGTFKLTWKESGDKLSGTIMISAFRNKPTSIHGTVHRSSISFGTVGSEAITYSGSVSGNSMSGTWKILGGGGGSWKASRA